jgi:hypothetical protein
MILVLHGLNEELLNGSIPDECILTWFFLANRTHTHTPQSKEVWATLVNNPWVVLLSSIIMYYFFFDEF